MDRRSALSGPRTMEFFLGGRDLEMETIAELLRAHHPRDLWHDKGLSWGARVSAYAPEVRRCLAAGRVPVLVELEDDMRLPPGRAVVVDHHGSRAEGPTSLEQVFRLLGLPRRAWTRRLELVAANDRAYIAGLVEAGATPEEIQRIRAQDRAAQGVTEREEREAERALESSRVLCRGRLIVVGLPHNRATCVADRLHRALGGPGYENLLIVSPTEVNFFGRGDLVNALARRWPGGWTGGNMPSAGFWGRSGPPPEGVDRFLVELLERDG